MAENNASEQAGLLNTNPKKFIIAGLAIIFLFFGGLGAWAAFFPFQGAVVAPGTVKVSGERKTVQHLEGGIVDEILVEEGERVEQGEVLIQLKSAQVQASVGMLRGRLWSKLATAARLEAESRMASEIDWPSELLNNKDKEQIEENMAKERSVFQARRESMRDKISQHRSQIDQLKQRIDGARQELKAQKEIIENLREEIASKQALADEDYLGKVNILELQRKLSERKGRKGQLKQRIAEYRQKIEEHKLQIVSVRSQYRERAVTKLSQVKETIFEVRERLTAQVDKKERLKVRAPIAGEVINMRIHSEDSGVVQAGKPLLDIVPSKSDLIVEARVRRTDITSVRKGQKTKVQLSAFNRRSTPPIPGKVIYISPDRITQETSQGQRSYYVAHIEVDKTALEESNAYLSPGMPATCYITTDKRNVLGYLLDPILQTTDKAMREG